MTPARGAAPSRLVGIAGPSCAGKTELARWLGARLAAPVLNLDHYYIDLAHLPLEERAKTNFDEPAAVDHEAIVHDVAALARGEPVTAPLYDFATHARARGGERIVPAGLVVVEGLFALYWPELREHFFVKLFVDAPDELCLARRLERDTRERGRTPESVLAQFEATVKPGADRFIRPTRVFADLVLSGEEELEIRGGKALELVRARLAVSVQEGV
ncbi:MAG: AAA family ATPase [Bryobacteraceae bacterium]|jgi:uridine kinase